MRMRSEEAKGHTITILRDPAGNTYLRRMACAALADYGDEDAVEALLSVLSDKSYVVRKAASDALLELGGGEGVGYDYGGDSEDALRLREEAIARWREKLRAGRGDDSE
jgi:HEAT repeat protein